MDESVITTLRKACAKQPPDLEEMEDALVVLSDEMEIERLVMPEGMRERLDKFTAPLLARFSDLIDDDMRGEWEEWKEITFRNDLEAALRECNRISAGYAIRE